MDGCESVNVSGILAAHQVGVSSLEKSEFFFLTFYKNLTIKISPACWKIFENINANHNHVFETVR